MSNWILDLFAGADFAGTELDLSEDCFFKEDFREPEGGRSEGP